MLPHVKRIFFNNSIFLLLIFFYFCIVKRAVVKNHKVKKIRVGVIFFIYVLKELCIRIFKRINKVIGWAFVINFLRNLIKKPALFLFYIILYLLIKISFLLNLKQHYPPKFKLDLEFILPHDI